MIVLVTNFYRFKQPEESSSTLMKTINKLIKRKKHILVNQDTSMTTYDDDQVNQQFNSNNVNKNKNSRQKINI